MMQSVMVASHHRRDSADPRIGGTDVVYGHKASSRSCCESGEAARSEFAFHRGKCLSMSVMEEIKDSIYINANHFLSYDLYVCFRLPLQGLTPKNALTRCLRVSYIPCLHPHQTDRDYAEILFLSTYTLAVQHYAPDTL